MKENLKYPKTIEELKLLVDFLYQTMPTESKNKLSEWEMWFNENIEKITIKHLEDSQYFKIFYNNDKKSLQVWKKDKEYEIIEYNLIANYYDEFCNDKTIITE